MKHSRKVYGIRRPCGMSARQPILGGMVSRVAGECIWGGNMCHPACLVELRTRRFWSMC